MNIFDYPEIYGMKCLKIGICENETTMQSEIHFKKEVKG